MPTKRLISPAPVRAALLFRRVELAFHTQYAEVKERARSEPLMLPGTPGTLALKTGTGHGYWYRRYHPVPGRQADDFVCKQADTAAWCWSAPWRSWRGSTNSAW